MKRRLLSAFVRFLTPGSWTLLARLRAGAVVALLVLAGASILSQPGVAPKSDAGSLGSTAWVGQPGRSPAGDSHWEAYTQARPDVLTPAGELSVTPRAHPELGSDWPRIRDAHLEAVAQMLELYPNEPLYFLARDSELLYDAARFLLRGEPATLARLHLLNISRGNMRAPHVLDYLAQEGISPESLRAGMRPVFIDTGFSGTIPRVVAEHFPPDVRGLFRTHLLSSSNALHPSSRVFLTGLNPAAASMAPSSLHGSIVSYEHLPRMTDRSSRFERVNGRWEAMSPRVATGSDGAVSAARGLAYREDLLAHLGTPSVRTHFTARRRIWRALRSQAMNPGLTRELRIAAYRRYLRHGPESERAFREAAIRDVFEWATTTRRLPGTTGALPPLPDPESLGLAAVRGNSAGSNKNALIMQYPQWQNILENPDAQIPALIVAGDYTTLGSILDVVQDDEIRRIAIASLGAQNPPSPQTVGLVETLIDLGNAHIQRRVAIDILSKPHWANYPQLVQALIDSGDPSVLVRVGAVLAEPHWGNHPEFMQALIDSGHHEVLKRVALTLFSPHWAEHPEFVRALIATGSPGVMQSLTQSVGQEHWANHPEFVRALIDSGDPLVLRAVAEHTLRGAHWVNQPDLVRAVIDSGESGALQKLAGSVLNQPHWANHPEFVRALIDSGDPAVLSHVAAITLTNAHWAGHPELVRALIASGDPVTLRNVAVYILTHDHWAGYPELVQALIDSGNPDVLCRVAERTLVQSHWVGHPELVRALIDSGNSAVLGSLALHTLRNGDWDEHPELVRALIEAGDSAIRSNVFTYLLAGKRWGNHPHNATWRNAVNITDPAARRAFLLARLGPLPARVAPPAPSYVNSPAFRAPSPGLELAVGERVRTPAGRDLVVISGPDTGRRGRVYRVRPSGGAGDGSQDLALKLAINSDAETITSIASESAKREAWHRAGLNHAPILEHSTEGHFTLSRFIEGTRADVWLNEWLAAGMPGGSGTSPEPAQLTRLRALINRSSERGIYIGDLNPKNLIWSGGDWVVIDSGGAREGIAPAEALSRYLDKIPARWARRASSGALGAAGCEGGHLEDVLRQLMSGP